MQESFQYLLSGTKERQKKEGGKERWSEGRERKEGGKEERRNEKEEIDGKGGRKQGNIDRKKKEIQKEGKNDRNKERKRKDSLVNIFILCICLLHRNFIDRKTLKCIHSIRFQKLNLLFNLRGKEL